MQATAFKLQLTPTLFTTTISTAYCRSILHCLPLEAASKLGSHFNQVYLMFGALSILLLNIGNSPMFGEAAFFFGILIITASLCDSLHSCCDGGGTATLLTGNDIFPVH